MTYTVIRKGWGPARVVGSFPTRAQAEAERRAWQRQTRKDFKEGRIMYDVPSFSVAKSGTAVTDESGRVVAHARTKAAAHRTTRRAKHMGTRVAVRPAKKRIA
jgi:hypothetical protein